MANWRDSNMGIIEMDAATSAAVMSNGLALFNASGDVIILNLQSECITPNGVTASTIQYSITPSGIAATTISGASASLASATAGTIVALDGTSLATAPNVYANSVGLAQTARGIIFPTGALTLVVAVGSTTGTWRHYIRYRPIEASAIVTPAF